MTLLIKLQQVQIRSQQTEQRYCDSYFSMKFVTGQGISYSLPKPLEYGINKIINFQVLKLKPTDQIVMQIHEKNSSVHKNERIWGLNIVLKGDNMRSRRLEDRMKKTANQHVVEYQNHQKTKKLRFMFIVQYDPYRSYSGILENNNKIWFASRKAEQDEPVSTLFTSRNKQKIWDNISRQSFVTYEEQFQKQPSIIQRKQHKSLTSLSMWPNFCCDVSQKQKNNQLQFKIFEHEQIQSIEDDFPSLSKLNNSDLITKRVQ